MMCMRGCALYRGAGCVGSFGALQDHVQLGHLDLSSIFTTVLTFSWQYILRQVGNPHSDVLRYCSMLKYYF